MSAFHHILIPGTVLLTLYSSLDWSSPSCPADGNTWYRYVIHVRNDFLVFISVQCLLSLQSFHSICGIRHHQIMMPSWSLPLRSMNHQPNTILLWMLSTRCSKKMRGICLMKPNTADIHRNQPLLSAWCKLHWIIVCVCPMSYIQVYVSNSGILAPPQST